MELREVVFFVTVVILCFQLCHGFWLWGDENKDKVDGQWGDWSNYSSCQTEKDLKIPYRVRTRSCDNPAPKSGGSQCKGQSLRKSPCIDCDQPLGMESKDIANSEISASTAHEEFPAHNARFNGPSAWCAKELSGEVFLQVDFDGLTFLTAIATQGYYPDPKELSLRLGSVSKYKVTYSDNGLAYEVYKNSQKNDVFTGNGNNLRTVLNTFDPQIAAKHIRVHPTAFIKFVCMKIELYGCRFNCGGYLPTTPGDLLAMSSETEDVDCFWQVHLPNSSKINFDFINFNLPCKNGQVQLRGGSPSYGESKSLGTFCQNETLIAPSVQTNGNKLWIRFQSDSIDANVGFYAIYFPSCDVILNGTKTGTISTPRYPKAYHHNSKCTWTISVSKGSIIQLRFLDFDVEKHSECSHDYLSIFDGNSSTVEKYCNSKKPPEVICSSSNTMKLVFKSDDELSLRGFKATFKTLQTGSPCIEEVTSSITPTPSLSVISTLPSFSSSSVMIIPTSTIQMQPSIKRNDSLSVLVAGSGVPGFGAGSRPGEDEEDDDEDTGLTTIIIISVFSFIVLCMLIASITPSLLHGFEKRKREREWLAAADLAVKKEAVQNEYEMQSFPKDKNKIDDIEADEATAFLAPADRSSLHEECHLVSVDDCTSKSNAEVSINAEDGACDDLENDTTDLNLSASYEDIGSSFANEMAALMFKYESTPQKDPEMAKNDKKSNPEDCEKLTTNIQTDSNKELSEENQKNSLPITLPKEKYSDMEDVSSPETECPENLTNSTISVRNSMDISNVQSVQMLPGSGTKAENVDVKNEAALQDSAVDTNDVEETEVVVPETFV